MDEVGELSGARASVCASLTGGARAQCTAVVDSSKRYYKRRGNCARGAAGRWAGVERGRQAGGAKLLRHIEDVAVCRVNVEVYERPDK